ncbi:MAG: T9SS type A sorting domain-containing protein [Lewinellaceae bacterium]|nr:T9SS type A sorting domain-containing protein [Lewinellaceae bacterium]
MKKIPFLLALLFAGAGIFAQNNEVVFRFKHQVSGDPLVLNNTVFSLPDGRKALLTRAEFYISEIELNLANGSKLPLAGNFMLVNANTPNREYNTGATPAGSLTGLTLHLGVDAAHNHLDPSSWPTDHPLAHQNPSMHWGWVSGYRFMAIEGLVDLNNDGAPEAIFQYHNLDDSLYRMVELTGAGTAENGRLLVELTLDYTRLFDKLDMSGNLTQHGSAPPNAAMMNNAATKNFIVLDQVSAAPDVTLQSDRVAATPNPTLAGTTIRYNLNAADRVSMILTNPAGQIVRRHDNLPREGTLYLETASLPAGVYRYVFYSKGSVLAQKQLVVVSGG